MIFFYSPINSKISPCCTVLFSSLPQPTIPKSPSIAQVHGWPSALLCLSLCSLWSLKQVKLSLFPQLHPHWPLLPGSSGSFCLSATPGHQSLIDTCHTCAKDLGEMQATVSTPLSPPLRVWDGEAYSSLWWSKVSECVYFMS